MTHTLARKSGFPNNIRMSVWFVFGVLHIVAVLSSPDPGIWQFHNLRGQDNYRGVVKNVFANTRLYIRLSCSGGANVNVTVQWMLRKTPCWEEYITVPAEEQLMREYFMNPKNPPMIEFYDALSNYTVHYVKPGPQTFSCDKPFVLQPYIEANDPAAGQLDQEAAKAGQPGEVGAASGQPGKEAAKAGQADGGGETKPPTRPAHQRQKRADVPASSHQPGQVSSVNSDSPQYVVPHDGVYLLVVRIMPKFGPSDVESMEPFSADLTVSFLSQTAGYLSLTDWPLLPFYGLMCGVYVVLGLLWFIFCSIHWRDILRLQFWIGGVIFLGMVEKAVFTSEYQNINSTGQATKGLIITAEIVSCAKRTLARMLVIIVSLGYGIVKPRLGPTLNRVVATGLFYFLLASVESVMRAIHPKNDPNNVPMMAAVPLAVIDASICWWVFSALIQTTRALRLRRNQVKLSVYKHFTNTLVFAVLSSIIFMVWSIKYHKGVECLTDWQDLWVDEAFWHLLFSVILLVIMVLWRPSQNNQRYAFTPLLDGDEDYSSDEDILYSDAWEGIKMRGKTTSRPETPSGVDPEEDPLGWVEENIAEMEPALPALDSEEELENTKLEISKLN